MKKNSRRAFLLLLTLLLVCLPACSGSDLVLTDGGNGGKDEPATTAQTEPAKTITTAIAPYTRAQLEAIPVANASMTSDQLRAICLDFAKMQCSIPWVASKDFKYALETSFSDASGNLNFAKNVTYCGLPYTAAGSSLYTFMDYLDEETGLLDESVLNRVGDLLGNNCSTSLFWSWSRVSSTITFTHTQVIVPSKGVIPLGPYTFDQNIESYKTLITKKICDDNGQQTMYESYAKLLLADGVVVNNQSDTKLKGNHVRMCSILPQVVRNADGTINGKESRVWFVEQDEVLRPLTTEDGVTVYCEGRVDSEYSFEILFEKGYIPFTIPELVDPSSVQKAAVSTSLEAGANVTLEELLGTPFTANYAFSKIILTFTDESGNATEFPVHATGVAKYSMDLSTRRATVDRQLKAGSYQVEITALVGSGETVPVFSGTLTKA